MRYSDEDALKEVLKRKDKVIRKRTSRNVRYLALAGTGLFTVLIAVICLLPAGATGRTAESTVYGAFLLGREAGGYVLAAVIAFVLGITVTLLCMRYRSLNGKDNGFKNRTDNEE